MGRKLHALASVALLLAVAGCSSEAGQASPAPPTGAESSNPSTSSSTDGTGLPYAGAPVVEAPLPPSIMDRDPCSVLTPTQVGDLFQPAPEGRPKDSGIAQTCSWSDPRKGSLVTIQLLYGAREGLSQFYRTKDKNDLWQPLEPVQGYPAVAYGPIDRRQTTGGCGVVVGVADDMVFQANATLSDANRGKADPCLVARRVADLAVTTLKAGA